MEALYYFMGSIFGIILMNIIIVSVAILLKRYMDEKYNHALFFLVICCAIKFLYFLIFLYAEESVYGYSELEVTFALPFIVYVKMLSYSYSDYWTITAIIGILSEAFTIGIIPFLNIPKKVTNKSQQINKVNDIGELKKYKELLDMGAITQEEYDAKKKELLNL